MFRLLLLVLLAIPVVELWLLIVVGGVIGGFACVLLVIATAVIGGILARRQGFDVFIRMRQRQAAGEPIVVEMVDALALLFAGVLLLLPGLLTDGLGFLLLVPHFRAYVHGGVVRAFQRAFERKGHHQGKSYSYNFSSEQDVLSTKAKIKKVIDVDTTKS